MLAPFFKRTVLLSGVGFLPPLSKIKWASSGLLNSGAHNVTNELNYEEQKNQCLSAEPPALHRHGWVAVL